MPIRLPVPLQPRGPQKMHRAQRPPQEPSNDFPRTDFPRRPRIAKQLRIAEKLRRSFGFLHVDDRHLKNEPFFEAGPCRFERNDDRSRQLIAVGGLTSEEAYIIRTSRAM